MQGKWDNGVLYVPMGWLLYEKVDTSVSLVYGLRKSFTTSTPKSKIGYMLLRELFAAGGRNVERMDSIANLLG